MPGRMLLVAAGIAVLVAPAVAHAQDYFGEEAPDQEITFRTDKPRTGRQRLLLAGLFGGAAVFTGVGVGFHLDSRSKSNDISALGPEHTGRIYDDQVDDTRRAALRSRTLAMVGYGAGGALLLAGIITFFVTDPGTEVVTMGKDKKQTKPPPPVVPASFAPLPGGGMLATGWSF